MLRNILRTSRWLARREFNSFTPIITLRLPCTKAALQSNGAPSFHRKYSSEPDIPQTFETVDAVVYDQVCNETLESLCDYFEELVESSSNFRGADVTYSDGVLTVDLGSSYGTYVINRQSPNKQIWLSSPVSGPKRYDLVLKNGGYWIYKHDSVTLHQLLQNEISKLVPQKVEFYKCSHSLV